jgi:hypothetical protein
MRTWLLLLTAALLSSLPLSFSPSPCSFSPLSLQTDRAEAVVVYRRGARGYGAYRTVGTYRRHYRRVTAGLSPQLLLRLPALLLMGGHYNALRG